MLTQLFPEAVEVVVEKVCIRMMMVHCLHTELTGHISVVCMDMESVEV